MTFDSSIFLAATKMHYEKKKNYVVAKLATISIVSVILAALMTYQSIDKLKIEDIKVIKVSVKNFKSGLIYDEQANITVFLDTDSIINDLKVTVNVTDQSNQEHKFLNIVSIVPDPWFSKNETSFDLPPNIKTVVSVKLRLELDNFVKEYESVLERID